MLATAATIIASQAVISGAFSLTQQAIQLGFVPRLRVEHTSASAQGQIYIPVVNWGLMVMVILLVLFFQQTKDFIAQRMLEKAQKSFSFSFGQIHLV